MEVQKKQYLSDKFQKNIRKRDRGKLEKYLSEADDEAFEELDKIELSSMTATTLFSVFFGGVSAGRFYLKDYFYATAKTVLTIFFHIISLFVTINLLRAIFMIIGLMINGEIINGAQPIFYGIGVFFKSYLSTGINASVFLINLFAVGWYILDIFECRKLCSELNLKRITACVNIFFAKSHTRELTQSGLDYEAIAAKQKRLTEKKSSLAKKYLDDRHWELIKTQLSNCDESEICRLENINYKKKWLTALLSFIIPGCVGKFYLGEYIKAGLKLVCITALFVITSYAQKIAMLGIIALNVTFLVIYYFQFEEIFNCREKLYEVNYKKMCACINSAAAKPSSFKLPETEQAIEKAI